MKVKRVANIREAANACFKCGKPLDLKRAVWIEVATDGTVFGTTDAESQGSFPVGRDCAKHLFY